MQFFFFKKKTKQRKMAVFSKVTNIALLTTAGVCFATTLALIYILQKQSKEELYEDFEAIKSSRHTVIEVPIPAAAIGAVIGRNGSNVAKIQEATSTRINFKNEVKGSVTRIAIIRGKPNDAQAAERLIRTAAAERMTITSAEMRIPLKACGYIIGKSGTNIRTIREMSNAKLQLESFGAGDLRTLTITGTPKEIDTAKALIEEMVAKALLPRKAANELSTANRLINYQHKQLCNASDQEHTAKKREIIDLVPTGRDQFLEVYVPSVESPDRFWVQPIGVKATELDKLVEEMTDFYRDQENISDEVHPDEVKVSDIFAAPFNFDNCWYRAKVVSIEEDEYDAENSAVRVYYVDFGDHAVCQRRQLYALKDEFKSLEFQAVECKMNDVQPIDGNWSEEAVNLFEELTFCAQWKCIMLKVMGEEESADGTVKYVKLVDTSGDTDVHVAEILVERGFARWKTKSVQ